jgi:hypothetical protein
MGISQGIKSGKLSIYVNFTIGADQKRVRSLKLESQNR